MIGMHVLTLAVHLLLSRASAAVVDLNIQQPLADKNHNQVTLYSQALKKLRDSVGARLMIASPVGKPCYTKPDAANPDLCDEVEALKTNDSWISRQAGGYFYGNWASCQSTGETCALPVDSSSHDVIPANSTCYKGSVPDYVVAVDSTEHIKAVFTFARDTQTPLVIKNTGHDWKGRSGGQDSLAIWTHHLRTPKVPIRLEKDFTPHGCSAKEYNDTVFHFGPGETWAGAYEFAENNNLAVLGGTCGTVGIAGWLSGGGHSPLTPVYGMGVDNVREVEIVTPQGDTMVVNECRNSDLFFAVRGGGGGTFGVVTKITYKSVPKFSVQTFRAAFNATDRGLTRNDVRQFFDILTSSALKWSTRGWGGYIKTDGSGIELINPRSTPLDAQSDLAPFSTWLQEKGFKIEFQAEDSWYSYFVKHLQPTSTHVGAWSAAVASRLVLPQLFDNNHRNNLIDILLDLQETGLHIWIMLVTPSTFPHTTTSSLHPSWKSAIWSIRINDRWDQFYEAGKPDLNRKHFEHVHKAMNNLREITPDAGVSINEADIWETNYEAAFWGEKNHLKLVAIKRQVDPENLLSNHMAVGWDDNADRYRCYPKKEI
ncbi:FAD-binding domain-containing protein [Delitschia confertaspora ATCC 74209]|uniref:FAD-binding domain-containing protein n=1 Tax=Delitschia confertaspora ATCC 74209 TaxID=1513339 RepID=A0A9P4JUE4_9PLEO|nr:FAD-binding domain-containing protein [Delitschia confertaspora ATCC 74209]